MWRLLLILSLFPIAAALWCRWWFGLRVFAAEARRGCRVQPERWEQVLGAAPPPEPSAISAGGRIHDSALEAWRGRDRKAAARREASRNFGLAVPPLTAMVAVFAVLLAKVPVVGALALVAAATALAAVSGLLGLGPELRALSIKIREVRDARVFPRADDEESAIRCAVAHAWDNAVPRILRWLQPAPKP